MKTFLTKLSSSLVIVLIPFSVLAKPVAQVIEITGAVFVIGPNGKTNVVVPNQHLEENSQIMVEEGASISLNDYFNATYHLIGGTHLKFFNKSVQLKQGKVWVQASSARHPLALTTANGHVDYWKGEFIVTFDQTSSRSQVLVVNGDVEVSNILDKKMKYTVAAGTFSLIDPEVENGIPRAPTRVGLSSLDDALAEFKKIPQEHSGSLTNRSIASVSDTPAPKKRGEIIFISTQRMPASVGGSAHNYYKKKTVSSRKETPVPIRIYGRVIKPVQPVLTQGLTDRAPASVRIVPPQITSKRGNEIDIDQEFSDSLKKHEQEQPKHPKELENLLQDLRSY